VQDNYNSGPFKSKIVCPLALAVIFISLVTWQRPCAYASTSTDINADKLAQFFVEYWLKECVLSSAMCRRRRMFAMMYLRNLCQVSIEEVRQVMTRSPVKVPLSTETVKGVGW